MSSAVPYRDREPIDDRSTKARIRDAAIVCFADHGIADTTARKVAAAAGVSPGLVIHHFGTMEGLRAACDEHVAEAIRRYKQDAMSAGFGLDLQATLSDADIAPLTAYLARVLADDSPAVARLVDELVADAEGYLRDGVEAGMLRPSEDPRSRAIVLTVWNLGALVLHRHLERMLGVDLTDPGALADARVAAYAGPVYEIYGDGILTDAFAVHARESLAAMAGERQRDDETSEAET